jgi:hypothetical protein
MKIVARILILLAITAIVAGAVWAAASHSAAGQSLPGGGPGGQGEFRPGEGGPNGNAAQGEGRHEQGFDPLTSVKNLGIIGLITAAFVACDKLFLRVRRRPKQITA